MADVDRRKHRRVKAKAAGTVRPKEKASSPGWMIENLSVGGVFVRCDEPLPVGSKVVTELLQQEGGAVLKLTGVVVATRDAVEALTAGGYPGMGIRFDPMPPDARARLTALLVGLSSNKEAGATGVYNPVLIDEAVAASRTAFDFGFVSLDGPGEEYTPAAPTRPTPSEPPVMRKRPAPAPASRAQPSLQPPPAPPAPVTMQPVESARLMIQVRGLLQELDETKSELIRREQELEDLRAALLRAKETLAAKDARIAALEHRLARGG